MLGQLIWWSSIALEMALLARGLQNRLAFRLPVFYSYIAFVIFQDLVRLSTFQWKYDLYKRVFWSTEFLGLAIGSLVVFEIYKVSLAAYPGAARMARNALAVVFLVALVKGDLTLRARRPAGKRPRLPRKFERVLRVVQAAAILH